MEEIDVVRLIRDYENIPAGTEGTIVYKYNDSAFEVEFFDENDDTIDVLTTPADVLELIWQYRTGQWVIKE